MLAYSMDRKAKLIDAGFSRRYWLAAHPAIPGIRMKHWPQTRRLCLEGQYRVADSRSKLAVNNLAAESKIFNATLNSLFSSRPASGRLLAFHNRISLDLDQPFWVDEAHDLHDRVCGADVSKELAVDCRDLFPILYSGQQNSGAGHIRNVAAQFFNC